MSTTYSYFDISALQRLRVATTVLLGCLFFGLGLAAFELVYPSQDDIWIFALQTTLYAIWNCGLLFSAVYMAARPDVDLRGAQARKVAIVSSIALLLLHISMHIFDGYLFYIFFEGHFIAAVTYIISISYSLSRYAALSRHSRLSKYVIAISFVMACSVLLWSTGFVTRDLIYIHYPYSVSLVNISSNIVGGLALLLACSYFATLIGLLIYVKVVRELLSGK